VADKGTNSSKIETTSSGKFNAGRSVFVLGYLAQTWETLWPRLVPLFLVACAFVVISWAGLWQSIPDWTRWVAVAAFFFAALASLLPLRNFSLPSHGSIYRRIEKASGFENRPVTAQIDKPANAQDTFSKALWAEHQKRMTRELDNLSAGTTRPDGNLFDKFALRAILPIFAFVALAYSYGINGGTIRDAIYPKVDTKLVLSRLDVWINPPTYSGKPPQYLSTEPSRTALSDQQDAQAIQKVSSLTGSELTIRYVGEEQIGAQIRQGDTLTPITADANPEDLQTDANKDISFAEILTGDGILEVTARDEVIASWQINLIKDEPPSIFLNEVPTSALAGALELTYSVEDDFGVVSAKGIIRRNAADNPNARPLVEAPTLQLPLPRARAKSGSSKVNRDLSSHPWAGSSVELTLEATDDIRQIGTSTPLTITLPGRSFFDPMAKALVEQRRILALDANQHLYVADLLDAVTTHPDIFEIDSKAYLALQSAYRMIAPGDDDNKLREAMEVLWETALALELGDLSEIERKLREAQERLAEALEKNASEEEIDKLMDELRQAMNDFLEQMAKEMAKNPIQQNPLANNQNQQSLTERDIERMMQRIEDLAKSGSKDAARELLAEMQRMMDNLRAGQHQQQRQAEGIELNQALDKLSELMQKQQELMDETFSMQRRQPPPQQGEQGQQDQDQQQSENGQSPNKENGEQDNGPMTPEEFAEAMKQLKEQQEALEQQLSELGEQLEDLGLDPSSEFGEAGEEMAEAGENLGKGKSGEAAGDQGQALDALRRGAQSMMQQMAGDRNQGGQQPGQAGQNGQAQSQTDPLGRRSGNGRVNDENTRIPGEIDAQRAREIMDAIRKRLSDPLRPLLERNYLERLLEAR